MAIIQNKFTSQNVQDFITMQDLFYVCLNKWRWFVLSVTLSLCVATYYLLTTPPVYVRTASILIKDDSKEKSSSTDMESFSDLGLFTTNTNVNNEMGTLKSPDIMREVVSRLHLEMDYQIDGRFHSKTIYGNQLPVHVNIPDLPENASATFKLHLTNDGNLELSSFTQNGEKIDNKDLVKGKLNDSIKSPIGRIVIIPTAAYSGQTENTIYVTRQSFSAAFADYADRLSVFQSDEKSNIITLSFQDVSTQRAEDVLNTLISVYNENWVKDKNQIAVSTSMFINERLGVIEGELGNVDNDISSFKSEHLLPDVQAAASMYMTQANEANTAIRELNNQVYMARYIKEYLTNENNKHQLLPVNSGIENENLATQLNEFNNKLLERNSLVAHSSTKNPLVKEMDLALEDMRSALVNSIDNQMVALRAQIRSLETISGQATSQIASNPKQSKYLLSVERQQKVKESLYLYLLQKREENELSQAFTAYITRIVAKPGGSMKPTAPVKKNILLIAFGFGMLIPIIVLFLKENMNTRIRGRKDLEGLTMPFMGEIPLYGKKRILGKKSEEVRNVVVKEGNRNIINEAFRVLRTNLEFVIGSNTPSSVIIVTSFNPGSGKTFLTMNMAVSFAIKNKRVLIIDGDLRRASLSTYINSPKIGWADYLGGQVNNIFDLIVTHDKHVSLDILPVGTIPPNPTELLYNDRLQEVVNILKQQYDIVFIDCPPVDIVADTQIIGTMADRTIFVLRAGLMERSMLSELENIYQEKKYKNLSIILNGTEVSHGHYGYSYSYKYGYYHENNDKSK